MKIFDENSKFITFLQSTLVLQTSCYNVAFLRKQWTFGERKEHRNSILMTRHYLDLGSASDWLNQISHLARPIRSTTRIWVVTRHQYGISALISQTLLGGETSGSVAKCQLFSQASYNGHPNNYRQQLNPRQKILYTFD